MKDLPFGRRMDAVAKSISLREGFAIWSTSGLASHVKTDGFSNDGLKNETSFPYEIVAFGSFSTAD